MKNFFCLSLLSAIGAASFPPWHLALMTMLFYCVASLPLVCVTSGGGNTKPISSTSIRSGGAEMQERKTVAGGYRNVNVNIEVVSRDGLSLMVSVPRDGSGDDDDDDDGVGSGRGRREGFAICCRMPAAGPRKRPIVRGIRTSQTSGHQGLWTHKAEARSYGCGCHRRHRPGFPRWSN